jgi:DNA-binding NarL/FixJ family response regulator
MEAVAMTPKNQRDEGKANVLVVAKPGRMRNSLQTLLQIMPRLKVADLASDKSSAMQILTRYNPALVILDVNLPDCQTWVLLAQIQQTRPQTRCLLFVDSIEQRRAAKLAGADAVLLKGFGTGELFTTIEQLLALYNQ